jgi:hypothetical protein
MKDVRHHFRQPCLSEAILMACIYDVRAQIVDDLSDGVE